MRYGMSRWTDRREQRKNGQSHKLAPGFLHNFWKEWVIELGVFLGVLFSYIRKKLNKSFGQFEDIKGVLVGGMYRQRGKYAGIFIHVGMVVLVFFGLTVGPTVLAGADNQQKQWLKHAFGDSVQGVDAMAFGDSVLEELGTGGAVLGVDTDFSMETEESSKPRSEVIEYTVQPGDTLSTVAEKFEINMDTIKWANGDKIKSANSIKPGQTLKIPPVTGLVHTVKSGETIYSIAKKFETDAQSIVDFPFNVFTNDETFALAVGQTLYIPDGVKPSETPLSPSSSIAKVLTPDAGVISGTGTWIWPAAGVITQPWRAWHKGIDIANRGAGSILAADSGKVLVAGWPDNSGYGNRVIIDHGNGFKTLYAHLSKFNVVAGQTVRRGDVVGQMGSTGRSTGTHLHFEIRHTNGFMNPLAYLK